MAAVEQDTTMIQFLANKLHNWQVKHAVISTPFYVYNYRGKTMGVRAVTLHAEADSRKRPKVGDKLPFGRVLH